MPKIRSVLFDIDGTLLDSFEFLYGAFEHAFDMHGIARMPRNEMRSYIGPPLEQVYAAMVPGCDAASMTEAHRQFQETHLDLIKLFPDTVFTLDELARRNIKLAAITTRSRRTSVRSLEVNHIATYFDIVLSAEDVSEHKPAPEPLIKALEAISMRAYEAIMVGDTSADILAGKNAGTKTAAALYGFGGGTLLELKPDYVIRELKELLDISFE